MQNLYRRIAAGTFGGLFVLALSGAPMSRAHAQDTSQNERLAYAVMYGGLHVGDAVVELRQTPTSYTTGLKLTTRGVAKWLREFRADLSGQGSISDDPTRPLPAAFRREWKGTEFASSMVMTYHPETRMTETQEKYVNVETGEEVKREDLPWNKNDRRRDRDKPVPTEMQADALDPMAAFVAARHQIMEQGAAKKPVTFRVPIYDGQRRYDVVGKTTEARTVTVSGQQYNVVTVDATLVPIFGFTEKGEERSREAQGKILFTADDRFIPVQVTIINNFLSGVMNLTGDCVEMPVACGAVEQQAADASVVN